MGISHSERGSGESGIDSGESGIDSGERTMVLADIYNTWIYLTKFITLRGTT